MDRDTAISAIWLVGGLILVGSAVISRRMPLGQTVRLAALWAGIILLAALIASYFT